MYVVSNNFKHPSKYNCVNLLHFLDFFCINEDNNYFLTKYLHTRVDFYKKYYVIVLIYPSCLQTEFPYAIIDK